MKKVSFVCTTYGRYTCVRRILEQYLQQDYPNVQLIIFNTDIDHDLTVDHEIFQLVDLKSFVIVNNAIDYLTNEPYTNRGAICRDAVHHAKGEYFMLADDDDVYLPWHIRQAVDKIEESGKDAWKPQKSLFAGPNHIELTQNTMEASVIVKMQRIREIGFRTDLTGYEGLSWYTKLRDEGQLNEYDMNNIPSYCFNWSDSKKIAGHKQSGDITNPSNFENHKKNSTDFSTEPLKRFGHDAIQEFYSPYYKVLLENKSNFPTDMWDKYASKYIFAG